MSDGIRRLTPRQTKYLKGLSQGKTKYDAAIAAGYSEGVAEATASHIDNSPAVRVAFAEMLRKNIPAEKIVQRIAEGLDAQKTEFAKYEGRIADQVDCVDFEQRRKYAELAAELGQYHVPKQELEVTDHSSDEIYDRLEQLLAEASEHPTPTAS